MQKNLFTKILLISISLVLLSGIGFWLYYLNLVSDVKLLKDHYPVFDQKLKSYKLVKEKPKTWVSLQRISKQAREAIVISEDWAFYHHDGIDRNQIEIAVKESLDEGKLTRGASTITQQVIKNALLTPEKSLVRKLKEVLLATELEKVLTKEEILEHYLNLIELGKDLYGIGPASQFYFKKDPSMLTAKEGAFLAMLLPSPVKYSQSFRDRKLTEFADGQIKEILSKLKQAKVITDEQRNMFEQMPLNFEDRASGSNSNLELKVVDPANYDAEEDSYKNQKYQYGDQEKEAQEILNDLEKERLDIESETNEEY